MATKRDIINSKWKQLNGGSTGRGRNRKVNSATAFGNHSGNGNRRSAAKALRDRMGISRTNGKKSRAASSQKKSASRPNRAASSRPTTTAARQAPAAAPRQTGGSRPAARSSAPRRAPQRNRKYNNLGRERSTKNYRPIRPKWMPKSDWKDVLKFHRDHKDAIYGTNGNNGKLHDLVNSAAFNPNGRTVRWDKDDDGKKWMKDAKGAETSSRTKRWQKNWKEGGLKDYGRKSPKHFKERSSRLYYTVQYGPDGKAK